MRRSTLSCFVFVFRAPYFVFVVGVYGREEELHPPPHTLLLSPLFHPTPSSSQGVGWKVWCEEWGAECGVKDAIPLLLSTVERRGSLPSARPGFRVSRFVSVFRFKGVGFRV